MSKDLLNYETMVERALKSVVVEALTQVAENGLPGSHHLYVTFATDFPGVELPDHLHEKFPEEMTIVLQHQFWDLTVEEGRFLVTLSFNDIQERLAIPFPAIKAFADPSVNFGLQLKYEGEIDVTSKLKLIGNLKIPIVSNIISLADPLPKITEIRISGNWKNPKSEFVTPLDKILSPRKKDK